MGRQDGQRVLRERADATRHRLRKCTARSELCTDPNQAASFISALTLAKSFVPIPLLGSPQDFIDALAGKGLLGQLFTSLSIKPLTFKNPKDVRSALSGRTNLFSIYASGIVPRLRHSTTVKIHAVIDRQGASKLTNLSSWGSTTGGGGSASGSSTSGSPTASASAAALAANGTAPPFIDMGAAGTVVYWRVE